MLFYLSATWYSNKGYTGKPTPVVPSVGLSTGMYVVWETAPIGPTIGIHKATEPAYARELLGD